jgi:hypothetical protein
MLSLKHSGETDKSVGIDAEGCPQMAPSQALERQLVKRVNDLLRAQPKTMG